MARLVAFAYICQILAWADVQAAAYQIAWHHLTAFAEFWHGRMCKQLRRTVLDDPWAELGAADVSALRSSRDRWGLPGRDCSHWLSTTRILRVAVREKTRGINGSATLPVLFFVFQ